MSTLSQDELFDLILVANSSFNDSCDIHTFSGYIDSYGDEIASFTTVSGIDCGFSYGKALESERGQIVIIEDEAALRLPLTQSLSVKDEITTRDVRWKVDGITEGITVLQVNLKRLDVHE